MILEWHADVDYDVEFFKNLVSVLVALWWDDVVSVSSRESGGEYLVVLNDKS